jgi:hypothetical protein
MAQVTSSGLTRAAGRRFALTLAGAFAVLAGVAYWRGRERIAAAGWILSAVLLLAALTIPDRLGPVERAWTRLGAAMSRITSPVFLGIIYFVVFTPAGFIRRTFGKNPIKHEPDAGSYWKVRSETPSDIRRRGMERQF